MGRWPRYILLTALVIILAVPLAMVAIIAAPLVLVWIKISGDGRRWRRLRSRLVDERPPLLDSEYLQTVGADGADAPLWVGVRSCLAEYWSVPPEAIHPGDSMLELWWMERSDPDYLDMVYRLEWALGVKIRRGDLDPIWWERPKGDQAFGACAGLTVRALRWTRGGEQGQP